MAAFISWIWIGSVVVLLVWGGWDLKKRQWRDAIFLILLGLIDGATDIGAHIAFAQLESDNQDLKKGLATARQANDSSAAMNLDLEREVGSARDAVTAVRAENADLRKQIDPLVTIARSRFPSLDDRSGLAQLATQLSQVTDRTTALEHKVTERHLGPHAAAIASRLKAFPPGNANIAYPGNDPEAEAYASELSQTLIAGGWHTTMDQLIGAPPSYGLGVVVRDRRTVPEFANALGAAFKAEGIPFGADVNPSLTGTQMTIVVGRSPDPC